MAFIAPLIPVITAVATVASTAASVGISVKQSSDAKKAAKKVSRDNPSVEANRRKLIAARSAQTGRSSTILAGRSDSGPQVARPTLLGES